MKLLLSRHGNTFAPGDKVVRAGSQNDLALVESGRQQAHALKSYLQHNDITPAAVYAGELQRQQVYAKIATEQEPKLAKCLTELDYGDWTGLTNEETIEKFGQDGFEAWEKYSQWPDNANWTGSPEQLIQDLHTFADLLIQAYGPDDTVLAVTSSGVVRYFLTFIPGLFDRHVASENLKVKTGHICQFTYNNNAWTLDFWNESPAVL